MAIDFGSLDIRENFHAGDVKALAFIMAMVKCEGIQIVEVGSWKGFSTAYLASVAKDLHGIVYCIDHWKGNEGTEIGEEAKQKDIYKIFEYNLTALGLWDSIKPMKMDSLSATTNFVNESLNLIFLDADHRYKEFQQDLINWWPKLKANGIICGHDCEKYYNKMTDEERQKVDTNLALDSITPIHPGVIKALFERFSDTFIIVPGSTVWYKEKD